jgi:uncharacterized protein Yka (UPF0111/DUF47 family)
MKLTRLRRDALSSLFDRGMDPMVVIRWKDIYERLEAAIHACQHARQHARGPDRQKHLS